MDVVAPKRITKSKCKKKLKYVLHAILQNSTAMPFKRCGNKYKCFFCYASFQVASELRAHTIAEHEGCHLQTNIDISIKIFGVKLDIAHLYCKLCQENCDTLDNFIVHLADIHKQNHKDMYEAISDGIYCFKLSDEELACLKCHEKFRFFGPLLQHTHRAHTNSEFICETCGITFVTKQYLAKHTQSVHKEEKYQCRHCDKKYSSVYLRSCHEKRSHDVKNRQCPVCSQILDSIHIKEAHMASVHNINQYEHKCDRCPKVYKFQNMLVNHVRRTHLKEKNVTCEICGAKFFDTHHLNLHMVRHSDAKPFQCDLCMKRFPRKKALELHWRIHANDRRCVCKQCGKAFVQTSSLKWHLRVHHTADGKKS